MPGHALATSSMEVLLKGNRWDWWAVCRCWIRVQYSGCVNVSLEEIVNLISSMACRSLWILLLRCSVVLLCKTKSICGVM